MLEIEIARREDHVARWQLELNRVFVGRFLAELPEGLPQLLTHDIASRFGRRSWPRFALPILFRQLGESVDRQEMCVDRVGNGQEGKNRRQQKDALGSEHGYRLFSRWADLPPALRATGGSPDSR